ncbi:MAG: chromosome segregation protein SMC [Bacteriovoracaceae bacterium]|mgnify:CR=1 FL=1|nr:chromosome segregation protein SMC [Bacteriovoracaceae bacterium]
MKLKRLIVHGFKSFKDRTTIEFDDGITGIVGPNGCGKSNIVDALFWVMGEQSAKHLRGNSMKDVIFSGSSKYGQCAFAEATLVLENNEGKHIHIGHKVSSPSEIQLTRKLYRNGETEYRLNNLPCRLRDIQEVFMDTGAGAKSYSIIAQGEINRLVQARPEERRTMIEEVAGITKFKKRKIESLRKIEQTELNLGRLQDLQQEIEKNLRSLQKQAEKAERARNLKEKVKRNEITVHAHKVFDHLKDIREFKTKLVEQELDIQNWIVRKDFFEVSLQQERIVKEVKNEKIDGLQKEYNEISRSLAADEERLTHLAKSQTEKEKLLESREEEIIELQNEVVERTEKITELADKQNALKEENNESGDFEEISEQLEVMKEDLEDRKAVLEKNEEEIEESKKTFQDLDQIIFKNTSKLDEYSSGLQDIAEEIEALESQYSGVSTQIQNERESVAQGEKNLEELSLKVEELKAFVETQSIVFKDLNVDAKIQSTEMIQLGSRVASLVELNESLEGVKEGASNFLRAHPEQDFELFGNLFQCEDQYTKSVQALIDEFSDALVSTGENEELLLNWSKHHIEEGLDYILPQALENNASEVLERLKVLGHEDSLPLVEALKADEIILNKFKALFQGYYIIPNLSMDIVQNLPSDLNFKTLSSIDGKVVIRKVDGAIMLSLSNGDKGLGLVERNNKIDALTIELNSKKEIFETLETQIIEMGTEFDEKRVEYEAKRTEFSDRKAEFAAKKSALESKLENLELGSSRLDILTNRKSEISKSRLLLMETDEQLHKKYALLKTDLDEQIESIDEIKEVYQTRKDTFDGMREDFLGKEISRKSFDERMESYNSQKEDILDQIERQNKKVENFQEMVLNYKEEIKTIEEDLVNLEKENQENAQGLKDREEILSGYKDELAQLLLGMQEREDEVKDLNQKIHKTEKDIVSRKIKLEQNIIDEELVVKNIFEKYRIDLRKVLGEFLELDQQIYEELADISSMHVQETENGSIEIQRENYNFTRRYGQDLKDCGQKLKQYRQELNRLGEINWQAIEDYERQKLRSEFLKVQEDELRVSLEDLHNAIAHIDTKSRERFKHAFNEVNTRFEKVFPIIFGGGNAHLKVVGDVDTPECGVDIIAQPPGKKMVSINLMSGGEKALTAVSLIFSIFLVKPSPFCLLDEVDAPLDDANVGRFNELLREMSNESQFILITHNKKTMELNDTLYGVTMQEPGVSKAVSVQLH